jgi:hypothetical protein
MRLNQETRNLLLADFGKLPRSAAVTHRDFENWLKGNNPHLRITFDPKAATENPEATLLSPPCASTVANLILIRVARGVLMLCHVVHDHRATCDHYG